MDKAASWRPPLLVNASLAIHGGAVIASIAQPALWPWAVGALVANHAAIAGAGLWPRSSLLGPNMTHLPADAAQRGEVCITIDDGPEPEVTPKVLQLLADRKVRVNFFCIGTRVTQYASLAREMVAAGHTIENHSERHLHSFSVLGPRRMLDEVARAQDSIEAATGQRPRYFRAPAGLRNPFLDWVLHKQGLRLASWTRRGFDTREPDADTVLHRLTHNLAGGDILLLHDANAARTSSGEPVILNVLPRLLDALAEKQLRPVAL